MHWRIDNGNNNLVSRCLSCVLGMLITLMFNSVQQNLICCLHFFLLLLFSLQTFVLMIDRLILKVIVIYILALLVQYQLRKKGL